MRSRLALGPTQLPLRWVIGDLSLEVKRPEREADHSPQTNAEVKNMWIYTSTPHTSLWCSAGMRRTSWGYTKIILVMAENKKIKKINKQKKSQNTNTKTKL
jgi:hypothetical protein